MKKFLVAIIALFVLAACAQVEQTPLKVGIAAPMTGTNAWIGEYVVASLEMAKDEINAAGGINGRQIQIILEDADNSAKGSTAANKLISQDEVDFIYSVTTPVTAAASAVAEQNGVPLFGFTAVPSFAKKNTWVFSDLRDAVQECRLLSEKALRNSHLRIAFLGNDADFSAECLETLKKEFVPKGGQLIANEMKVSNDPDARTSVTKIKNAKPDAVVLVCWPQDCNMIYKQMFELDFIPQFYLPIGTALSANPLAVKDLDKDKLLKNAYAADQGISTDNPSPEFADFIKRYEASIGKKSLVPLADAAVAYDNMYEIATAAKKCADMNKECIRDRLSETDYTGVAGRIKFDGKHYAARPARVVQYSDGKWVSTK
jgi:branched-chain amino acid transport system substrate-binding protein